MKLCLAANGRCFDLENVKCTAQFWKVRMMRVNKLMLSFIFFFPSFGGVRATVFTKLAVIQNLFGIQTSVGACWKGIHALHRNWNRWRYKSVWKEWAPVLGQLSYLKFVWNLIKICHKKFLENFESFGNS